MIEKMINELTTVLETVNSELTSKLKTKEDRYKFADLMDKVRSNHSFDLDKTKELEPVVRIYIKNYTDYEIARGVGGGIRMKQEKKAETKKSTPANDKTKEDLKALIDRKIAEHTAKKEVATNAKAAEVVEVENEFEPEDQEDGF